MRYFSLRADVGMKMKYICGVSFKRKTLNCDGFACDVGGMPGV